MPISLILSMITGNPITSIIGGGVIWSQLGSVFNLIASGASIGTVLMDPHFGALLAGFGGLAAKDGHK